MLLFFLLVSELWFSSDSNLAFLLSLSLCSQYLCGHHAFESARCGQLHPSLSRLLLVHIRFIVTPASATSIACTFARVSRIGCAVCAYLCVCG